MLIYIRLTAENATHYKSAKKKLKSKGAMRFK